MREKELFLFILPLLVFALLLCLLIPETRFASAAINQTVLTKVNVTNTNPYIYNVTVTPGTVTLTPGATTQVICNATVVDYNGAPGGILEVNATFHLNSVDLAGPAKNDTKYIVNCANVTTFSSTSALYSCNISVWYFARNGTWNCSVTVRDTGSLNATDVNSTTAIQPLVAFNVSDVLDYGNIPGLNISDDREANMSNFGNVPLNISVRGWGGQNESLYPNLSMICELGNISIDDERYNITSGQNWNNMVNLTNSNKLISGLIVYSRNDTDLKINKTYWKIRIPTGVSGLCNGTLLFTASNY
jgi:hypothetical protein